MELKAEPGKVSNIFQEQLRSYISKHHEDDYLLVDVRERAEYEAGHIPGAKLMPLSDFDVRVAELAKLVDKHLIFYCRNGARSSRASEHASSTIGFPKVFNLIGGYSAWSGASLTESPRLRTMHVGADAGAIVLQALDLEKGAHRLYAALTPHFADTEAATVIEELAGAEVAHARVLYDLLGTLGPRPAQGFEALFDSLAGELLEDGQAIEAAVEQAKKAGEAGSIGLLEMALEIELRAYDLYKNLADAAPNEAAREALANLAQHEKRHANSVLRKLERLASRATG